MDVSGRVMSGTKTEQLPSRDRTKVFNKQIKQIKQIKQNYNR